MANEGGPALYTVEEAARLLRVGRTKAYAMTQEWRATGGRSGLPVVDFGHVLRVPRSALERVLGVGLGDAPVPAPASKGQLPPAADPSGAEPPRASRQAKRRPHPPAGHTGPSGQLDLFVAS